MYLNTNRLNVGNKTSEITCNKQVKNAHTSIFIFIIFARHTPIDASTTVEGLSVPQVEITLRSTW